MRKQTESANHALGIDISILPPDEPACCRVAWAAKVVEAEAVYVVVDCVVDGVDVFGAVVVVT